MTYEQAREAAITFWDGLYSVRLHRDDIWKVTLHSVDGPVHFVKDGKPYCHESHGCNLPETTANGTDWDAYNTPAHVSAQAACRHLIHCAVDGHTRKGVMAAIDNARGTGDLSSLPILLAQLTGPCVIRGNSHE